MKTVLERPSEVGDKCRVIQYGTKEALEDGTLWEVTEIEGFRCMIRESGTNNRPQEFDTSLLLKVA